MAVWFRLLSCSHFLSSFSSFVPQDHLGWRRAHLVGFSMGGMVTMKLAAHRPDRVLSLTVLGVTGGGWQVRTMQAAVATITGSGTCLHRNRT